VGDLAALDVRLALGLGHGLLAIVQLGRAPLELVLQAGQFGLPGFLLLLLLGRAPLEIVLKVGQFGLPRLVLLLLLGRLPAGLFPLRPPGIELRPFAGNQLACLARLLGLAAELLLCRRQPLGAGGRLFYKGLELLAEPRVRGCRLLAMRIEKRVRPGLLIGHAPGELRDPGRIGDVRERRVVHVRRD